MLQHYLLSGFGAVCCNQGTANPQRRPHLLASLALQEAEGSRTIAHIRGAKAAEIPQWLDEQMQCHVNHRICPLRPYPAR